MRINLILFFLFCVGAIYSPQSTEAQTEQPNVVIVMTDDQGYGDLSCHGNPILKTPNLDKLYGQSLRLTNYHVAPTCSPTRAALMTGHWSNRTGVWHTIVGRSMLRNDEITMGQVFKDAGYATGMFGKWHLGDNYPYRAEDRGFSEVLRHGGGGVGQTPDYWDNSYFDGRYWHNSTPVPVEGFCTDVFFESAKKFIKSSKESNKPFMAYIATNAAHGPMHCPEEFSQPYADQEVGVANFLGMIANIDHNVGELRKFLDEEGLSENTIFIFTTDNGTAAGHKIFNSQMRGNKGSEYEGGHRVPFFIHWPAGNLQSGKDNNSLAAHVDVLPTLIELCELDDPQIKFDGRSIAALFDGEQDKRDAVFEDRILITDSQRVQKPVKWRKSSVMSANWRLINGKELYDLTSDPSQTKDVAKDHPDVVQRLTEFYDEWWEELTPTFSQGVPTHIGHDSENPVTLTSHDWITNGGSPWNQAQIRQGFNNPNSTGFWNVHILEAGTYEIAFRRWPREADAAIDAALEPGEDVPGVKAMRARPGKAISPAKTRLKINNKVMEKAFEQGAKEVVFQVELEAGTTQLSGRFVEADGTEYGTYYAYVEKTEQPADGR